MTHHSDRKPMHSLTEEVRDLEQAYAESVRRLRRRHQDAEAQRSRAVLAAVCDDPVAAGLWRWTEGMRGHRAAVELLVGVMGGRLLHGPWIRPGDPGLHWLDADLAQEHGGVLSGGERRVLDIACSLVSSDHPVDLGDAITGLDPDTLRCVLAALAHAGGQPLP